MRLTTDGKPKLSGEAVENGDSAATWKEEGGVHVHMHIHTHTKFTTKKVSVVGARKRVCMLGTKTHVRDVVRGTMGGCHDSRVRGMEWLEEPCQVSAKQHQPLDCTGSRLFFVFFH